MKAVAARDFIALSPPVYADITDVLTRPKFARGIDSLRRNAILQRLDRAAIWFTPTETVFDCRDVDDNKYLELALAARATAITTGDKDLLVLHPWRDIHILSPSSFLNAAN